MSAEYLIEGKLSRTGITPCGVEVPAEDWFGLGRAIAGDRVAQGIDGLRPVHSRERALEIIERWRGDNFALVERVRIRQARLPWTRGTETK